VLGEILTSVIVHGSLTLDDYAPGQRDDVDLLAIVDRSLTRALRAEQAHAPCRLDLRFVTRAVATTPPESPPMQAARGDREGPP
jgi:hypothetical protein